MSWVNWILQGITSYTQLLTLAIQALTLAVLAWTLLWVRRYTRAAQEQVKASLEQLEAQQRPFLIVEWEELSDPKERLRALEKAGGNRPILLASITDDGVRIKNIGCGPGLNVTYSLTNTETEEVVQLSTSYFPHLPPAEGFRAGIGKQLLDDPIDNANDPLNINREFQMGIESAFPEQSQFAILYESLRSIRSETKVTIQRALFENRYRFLITDVRTTKLV